MLQRIFGALLLLVFTISIGASAQFFDPALNWYTIETPHFRVIYHEGAEGQAQKTAEASEEAWEYWTEKLGYSPERKVDVVVVDQTDGPNGFANLVPNNQFVDFTSSAGFATGFGNSEVNSWEDLLAFHEYGHIADLDFVSGLSETLRGIFGRNVVPGTSEPTLLVEGIPTYGEFEYRGFSRANDSRNAMMLRAMMLENNYPESDASSFYYQRDQWPPVGSISHDIGPWFIRYLEETYGTDTYRKIKVAQTSNPMWAVGSLAGAALFGPFTGLTGNFDDVYEEATGKRSPELWSEFKVWVNKQFSEQVAQLQEVGLTTSRQLTNHGYFTGGNNAATGATWSPDGEWIYYGHFSPGVAGGVRRVHPDGTDDEPLLSNAASFNVLPDGSGAIFVRGDTFKKFYARNDLYHYDFETEKVTRLTEGERPLSIAVSPDGNSVVYARYNWGDQTPSLSRLDLTTGETTTIQEFPGNVTIEQMSLSPDGQTIAVSAFKRGGFSDIYTLPVDGGELTPVTQDRATDGQPFWSADGEYLYFSSDRTGVTNSYAYDVAANQGYQTSNVLTGAYTPRPSPDGSQMAFSGYSSEGYDIHLMDVDRDNWEPVTFEHETIPDWDGFPVTDYEVHPYDPTPSLMPKLWLPVFGENQAGITTFGQDALFSQVYNFSGGWNWEAQQPFFDLFYTTSDFLPTIAVFGGMAPGGYYAGGNANYPLIATNSLNMNMSAGVQHVDFGTVSQTVTGTWNVGAGSGFDLFAQQHNLSVSASMTMIDGLDPVQKVTTNFRENLKLPVETPSFLSLSFTGGWSDATVPQLGFGVGGPQGAFGIRGFAGGVQAGKLAAAGTLQFNHRIASIEKGIDLWPVFFDDINGSLFVDAGMAGDELGMDGLQVGFGAEVTLTMNLFSYFGGPGLSIGVAQGVGEASPQIYITLGGNLLGLF